MALDARAARGQSARGVGSMTMPIKSELEGRCALSEVRVLDSLSDVTIDGSSGEDAR